MDALDERTMVDALADYFGLDVTDLRRDVPDPAALAMIPEDVAREYLAIPVRLEDRTLHVAVAQPSDDLRFLLSETSGCSVRLRLAPMSDIRWAIDRTYQAIGSLDQYVQAFEAVETTRKKSNAKSDAPTQVAENAPVVQVVDRILTQAVRDRASDVHIEPSQDAVYIRYRIDGALKDVLELPVSMGTGLVSRIKIMAGIDIVEKRRSQDGQFSTEVDDKGTDVRVRHRRHHLGREVRAPDPRQEPFGPSAERAGHARRHLRDVLEAGAGALRAWCCAPARPEVARPRRSTRR